ncbi:Integrase core domain protein (plasmid) [Phaeobacter gallaeciensis]|uniref:Integrase core domain protein n=1 Tax=Phaeobacter gallaeciensis TaxID=60890 RepID=A0AAC9ZD15_9RHOB|nr:Integrase core domain protein [Phaeobacter gallaeciensis DSM 26640]ATE95121.1 Integrase core domain protein [Phaeobacter gallaeciensis]ATE99429.1 Integrase core domain protein [Phaeobacter gallaeciensis]ATF03826.1 Integrase core domain protein [Phaeobacter gallaeciensis]ATF08019.1 Integrase core domain protein [Phaeobacter gallaeciensis]
MGWVVMSERELNRVEVLAQVDDGRLKYQCVYLHAWETGSEAKAGVGKWVEFYNRKRPHFALGGTPPHRGLLDEKTQNPPRSAGAEGSLNYARTFQTIGD